MPGFDVLGVDLDALHNTIGTLRTCADALRQQSHRITEHPFGAGSAGRDYSAQGAAVQAGLERIASCLHNWSIATAATADVFAHAATEYERLDREHADRLTAVHP
ncbi:hypothetical protein OHB26_06420 [Nocardia sp. NBC_01503]|uniref:hypothetical protein n=1 Tax=Nocardia sp. NBC_01503 TaxID=2975997 RepID=UPI002E7BD110|nr:hypothetical protein [Nocardia sp. NBC_01503]WTL33848.1 hypothetical protein OHB26_06420 [Nocardia sp. NBC_01503]